MKYPTILLLLLGALLSSGCRSGVEHSILPDDLQLRQGDLVFRRGMGIESRVVYAADDSGEYSHVGIVAERAGRLMIVHAVPGEPDFDGDPDRVKADSPDVFFSSLRAEKGAVCRLADSVAAHRAAEYALQQFDRHILFDHDYDDADSSRLYCCELVVNACRSAGITLIGNNDRHHFNLPGFAVTDCILPSDIFNSQLLSLVQTFH